MKQLKNKRFLIWLTGFYEGEGSTFIYNGYRPYVKCGLGQNNKAIMYKIKKQLSLSGVKTPIYKHRLKYNNKMFYLMQPFGTQAKKFLKLIKPYLQCSHKIKQINKVLKVESNYIKEIKNVDKSTSDRVS